MRERHVAQVGAAGPAPADAADEARRPVNVVVTAAGKLRAVCEHCGRRSVSVDTARGRLSVWDLAPGWSEAPYSPDFVHRDGSVGSMWSCPACTARSRRGEALPSRDGGSWVRLS